ncbi:homeodomain-like protein [Tanacetum coccineum]
MEDTLSKFMGDSTKRHEENSNLIKEIRASTDAAIRNQGASIKTLEIQIRKMCKEKDLGSFTLPCFINNVCFNNALVDLGASISVMPLSTYLNLGLGELAHTKLTVELADSTVKYPKGIAENVLLGIGEVIEEFRTRDDELNVVIDDYPSYCDYDKKIHINCAYNLKFSCMIGFEFTYANFFPLLYVNVMSKMFHNSIMKEKLEYKGNNVVGTLMNVHVFVGTFSVMTDFAVLENMDACRDEGMGDVIFGELFLREVGIKTRWFEWTLSLLIQTHIYLYKLVTP